MHTYRSLSVAIKFNIKPHSIYRIYIIVNITWKIVSINAIIKLQIGLKIALS